LLATLGAGVFALTLTPLGALFLLLAPLAMLDDSSPGPGRVLNAFLFAQCLLAGGGLALGATIAGAILTRRLVTR